MDGRTILVVEDDTNLGRSLEQGLCENGFTPTRVTNARDAQARLLAGNVALVVLDLGLPDADGLELLARWRREGQHAPVIITTARGQLSQRLQGLETGADDYLVKPYAFAELLARIHVQLRHAQQQSARQRLADLEVDTVTRTVTRAGKALELTPREFDLLVYLLAAHSQTVTREMLARDVWKLLSWTVSLDNVMDVHISRLREKLDKNQPTRLLHTVRGVGFALRERP
jgi:DNA-binding response OmpR family regulator